LLMLGHRTTSRAANGWKTADPGRLSPVRGARGAPPRPGIAPLALLWIRQ
jgi:hypothetical protein